MSKHNVIAKDVAAQDIAVPGSTANGFTIQFLNDNPEFGPVTSIFRAKPGTSIPAHIHANFAETHYVLEGDFIENGVSFGPGAFFSHAPGTVHGPHDTKNGYTLLTTQTTVLHVEEGNDFKIA